MTKVLIVEDTEVNRIVLSHRLQDRGFDVVLAVDGQEAVAKARRELPDIILLDMYLPIMDGDEVAQVLKHGEATRHIPIIALTAHAMTKRREQTIGIGCDEYETKPVDFERLLRKIEKLVGHEA
jgi:CheY-like chemotaxis protein